MLVHFVIKIVIEVIPTLTANLLMFAVKPVYGLVVKVISVSKRHYYLGVYADLEEILGDFLEKYRDLVRKKPLPSRWGFFVLLISDVWGLFWGLLRLAIQHLFRPDSERA